MPDPIQPPVQDDADASMGVERAFDGVTAHAGASTAARRDRIEPAALAFDAAGHPVSLRHGDVYKSRAGALAEARDVFVDGCRLRERWSGARAFVLLELGFGLGVNFLATLRAWRDARDRPARLHFVSVEAHPVTADALRRAHEALAIAGADADALASRWPPALPGVHRVRFEDGAVTLTLVLGEAGRSVPQLALAADAIFLDGFSPARNPEMWTPALMKALARVARPGATVSTYTAAASVRDALDAAGFEVRRVTGFGGKRDRLEATYAPRWRTFPPPEPPPRWPERSAVVVGAGLAGCHVAGALAERGWRVTLLERADGIAREGSSQPVVADHLQVSPDDNALSRLTRAALLMRGATVADRRSRTQALPRPVAGGAAIGRLQLASDAGEAERQRALVAALGFPTAFIQALDADAASDAAGLRLARGGLWLPMCEASSPAAACAEALGAPGRIALRFGAVVDALRREDGQWTLLDPSGVPLAAAPVVVLANAGDAVRLAGLASAGLRRLRGQTTRVSGQSLAGLRTVLGGDAYACPMAEGGVLIGSTYDDGDSLAPDPEADLSNLRRLRRVVGDAALPDADALRSESAAVGFRFTTRDRMPVIGPIPDEAGIRASAAQFARNDRLALPNLPGLFGAFGFGSRGQLWARLAGELLADMLDGEPMPLERDLLDAIAPQRMLRHLIRTRRLR